MASRYRVVTLAAALAVGVAILPARARAQNSGPEAGSWAIEGGINNSLSASLLRFTSPSAALVFRVGGNYSTSKVDASQGPTYGNATSYTVNANIGYRGYRAWDGNVRPFTTFGVLGGVGGRSQDPDFDERTWNAGAFAELGATYMLTSHLSVGGSGDLTAIYYHQHAKSSTLSEQSASSLSIGLGEFRLLATVYF